MSAGWPFVVVIVAAIASTLSARITAASLWHRWHRWLHIGCVGAWAIAAWTLGLRLLHGESSAETGARALLVLIVAVAGSPLTRDVLAGLLLVLAGPRLGDEIESAGRCGRVLRWTLRSAVLQDRDGRETTIPHRHLADLPLSRGGEPRLGARCEFSLDAEPRRPLDELARRLFDAAVLSPYAAPGQRPEVSVVADQAGLLRLQVRGFACDPSCVDRYRGDVLTRAGIAGLDPPPRAPATTDPPA